MSEAGKEKRSFFTLYKPGQGKYVRWGTVIGMAIAILCGAYWIGPKELADRDPLIQIAVAGIWTLGWGLLTFWIVSSPNPSEFLIMTESEMRKVTWPSRREVLTSTKVVIVLTLLLGAILWLVDVGFLQFFRYVGIE